MTETINGRPKRKQLSEQLDRLDGIIDALAEGLNKAVADAAREGTRLAVKDAILEIISNPELRALLASSTPPAPVTTESAMPTSAMPTSAMPAVTRGSRVGQAIVASVKTASGVMKGAANQVANRCRKLWFGITQGLSMSLVAVRPALPTIIGVGAVAAWCLVIAPHTITSIVGAMTVAVVAVTAAISSRLRRAAEWLGVA